MTSALSAVASDLLRVPAISLALTLLAYEIGLRTQRKCGGSAMVNPVLIAVVLIITVLELLGTSYGTYFESAGLLHFLLGPAVVALAVPIYNNASLIRGSALAILAGVAAGALVGSASAVVIAWMFGAPNDLLLSIAPKSVTTPIAIGISEEIGGQPSVTAVMVILTGIIGAIASGYIFDWIGVKDWEVRGLASGITAHGIGTAQMLRINETAGAFAGLAIGLTGLFTAFLLPLVLHVLLRYGIGA